jgi:hypothetical protein
MRTPEQITNDMKRLRIREAAHRELVERGRAGLRPGRVARRAHLPVAVVEVLVPDLEAAMVDEVEARLGEDAEITAHSGLLAAAA